MENKLSLYKPSNVWKYFEEILTIPRPSKKEEKIIKYLIEFAEKNNLPYKKDDIGNILITKPPFKGFENKPTIVLQSHMDMVCEKNADVNHNFDTDPIPYYIDDGWVKSNGTTLGADNGIGIAIQLAILEDYSLKHGKLECLFTVDEESGLTGAYGIKPNFFEGKYLINIDSEDEGIIYIGCAGGIDTTGILKFNLIDIPKEEFSTLSIKISGLNGGHSGDDINKGFGNAIKFATRILFYLFKNTKVFLSNITGGNLPNAIPREASFIISFKNKHKDKILGIINEEWNNILNEYKSIEKNAKLNIEKVETPEKHIDIDSTKKIISVLYSLPHGVICMNNEIKGLVSTSTNLASIQRKDNVYEITTSQRSDVTSLKTEVANRNASIFMLAKINYYHSIGYPGWKPNPQSILVKKASKIYETLFNKKPKITAIHAGLECGVFTKYYPYLDMISIGPNVRNAHSPSEMLEIKSVEKFYQFLTALIENF